MATLKKEHKIVRQGKEFVLYEGLLALAHEDGLSRISTTLMQVPHEDNGNTAICAAEVQTSKGTFSGIGDAAPGNVNRMIVPHLIRMAETRAKARALRDAVNVGIASVEELGGGEEGEDEESAPAEREPYRSDFPKASSDKPASANQLATIAKLSRLLGEPEQPSEGMSGEQASEHITELSRIYNERKGTGRRRA